MTPVTKTRPAPPPTGGDPAHDLLPHARHISELLKAMAHESRLVILCTLFTGDKSVSELEAVLGLRQPAVSQQLARLRGDGLVSARREGKMIYYSIVNEDVRAIIAFLCELYGKKRGDCPPRDARESDR